MIKPQLLAQLLQFRADRDWQQFHSPKNLAISISIEAAELLEHFQWAAEGGNSPQADQLEAVSLEMADIAMYLSYLAHDLGIDLDAAIAAKIQLNDAKYPVELARGKATKYSRLQPPAKTNE